VAQLKSGSTLGSKAIVVTDDPRLSDARSPTAHDHDERYYTESETDTLLSGKSNTAHTHDDRYYTESEMTTLLAAKADSTTLSGHTGNATVHVTQTDKDNWNKPSITISATKPTDGSVWYEITG